MNFLTTNDAGFKVTMISLGVCLLIPLALFSLDLIPYEGFIGHFYILVGLSLILLDGFYRLDWLKGRGVIEVAISPECGGQLLGLPIWAHGAGIVISELVELSLWSAPSVF